MKLLCLLVAVAAAAPPASYNTGAKRVEGKVNVHIVSHSHDDVGWLKTVDEYYYGANNSIQHANVNSIISATVLALLENPDRKFIEVEQAFFSRWWSEQTPAKQAAVKTLVANGQLEMINGGWSMHDEACPSFIDMIDNTALGQRLIYENFGVVPKTTWQVDPFGHSAFQGSMLSSPLSGVNGVYVARMDYQEIQQRKLTKSTEMFWTPSPSAPDQGGILGFLPYWYYAPNGFNFGGDDGTQPVMDDPDLEDYNVPDVVSRFNALIRDQLTFTAGEDVMIMMATDFSGENAETWYRNIDKLIHHVNENGTFNALYSTPSIYTSAKLATTALPQKSDDGMPYFDDAHAVWSGYFSSRPALKGYVRDSSRVFQAAKQLQAAAARPADMGPANPLYLLERAMGVTQHHDAVSGTSKQHVANDYALRLAKGRAAADGLVAAALAALTGDAAAAFLPCDLANATICPALEAGAATVVAVYNSGSQARAVHVRLPVGLPPGVASYAVFNSSAAPCAAQLLPLTAADAQLRTQYYAYNSSVPVAWLAFNAEDVPPMGYAAYFLQPAAAAAEAPATAATRAAPAPRLQKKQRVAAAAQQLRAAAADTTLSNGLISLTFDGASGLLKSYANAADGINTPFTQSFFWWNSSTGNYKNDGTGDYQQSSGAYIFRPNNTDNQAYPVAASAATTFITAGPVVWEARQVFADWAVQTVRLWAGSDTVEFEYTIGPIPFADGLGKEIVSRYSAPAIASAGAWTSDSNGRDAIRRRRNHRDSWNYTVYEPVAGNFVPCNLWQSLSDAALSLGVVVDRSQAGASLADGQLEFMVHRRLLADDNRGVGEPLNESGLDGRGLVVRGVHRAQLAPAAGGAAVTRLRAAAGHALWQAHLALAANSAGSPAAWAASHRARFSALAAPLPPNLAVVTLHAQSPRAALLRVAHQFAAGEGPLAAPASVDLASLLAPAAGLRIIAAEERILPGTVALTAAPVTTIVTRDGRNRTLPVIPPAPAGPALTITLQPMDIRTFFVQLAGAEEGEAEAAA